MKILSKFEDYYDPCQYMCGEDVVYERVMNNRKRIIIDEGYQKRERVTEDSRLSELDLLYKQYFGNIPFRNLQTSILFIGDIIVQFLHYSEEIKEKDNKISYKEHFLYKEKDIMDFYEREIRFINKNAYIKDKNKLKDFQKKVREIVPEVPLIYFGTYAGDSFLNSYHTTLNKITLNPMLKTLKFQNKMESFEVIQEIELFLKKLQCVEKEVKFSDKEKIIQAGFDLKNSFRKK